MEIRRRSEVLGKVLIFNEKRLFFLEVDNFDTKWEDDILRCCCFSSNSSYLIWRLISTDAVKGLLLWLCQSEVKSHHYFILRTKNGQKIFNFNLFFSSYMLQYCYRKPKILPYSDRSFIKVISILRTVNYTWGIKIRLSSQLIFEPWSVVVSMYVNGCPSWISHGRRRVTGPGGEVLKGPSYFPNPVGLYARIGHANCILTLSTFCSRLCSGQLGVSWNLIVRNQDHTGFIVTN